MALTTPPYRYDLHDPDVRLMLQVRDGNAAAFEELVLRYQSRLLTILEHLVNNREQAEDLAQEVFLRVYRSRASYEPSAKFTTWLFRIATHLALNYIRDTRREKGQQSLDEEREDGPARQFADRAPTVEQEMLRETRMAEVRRAIAKLPEKQRAAVLMHKYREFEYSRIARSLECSESAVKSLLFRAYETLRSTLRHMA